MKKIVMSQILFFSTLGVFSQDKLYKKANDFSQSIKIDSSVNVILLGENHKAKEQPNVLCEYVKILTENDIDTVFIEERYSTYVMLLIYNRVGHFNCLAKVNKVVIPVDVEADLAEALDVIDGILAENNLTGTFFSNENINISSQYRKTGSFNQKFVLHYIEQLQKNVEPFIKNYNVEFNKLLEAMYTTYSTFEPHEFDNISSSRKRDSLMSLTMGDYINEHKLKRWGGVFGSYHISIKEDNRFDKSYVLEDNLMQFLIKKELLVNDPKFTTRIIYDAHKWMINSQRLIKDEFIVSFYPDIKRIPKNKILIELHNNTWWLFSKR